MKEMFLLGAGASVEADVPDSYGMTERILNAFETDPNLKRYARVVSFVAGGLLFQNAIRGLNPLKTGVNVEELFNAIDILANRHTLEVAPFVGSWHSMIDEFDRIDPPQPNIYALHRAIYKSVTEEIFRALPHNAPPFGDSDIDRCLMSAFGQVRKSSNCISSSMFSNVSRAIGQYVVKFTNDWLQKLHSNPIPSGEFQREFKNAINQTSKPGEGQIFDDVAEYMIRSLANIVWIDNIESVSYLNPLLEFLVSQKQLTIASLNYDNSIELLSKKNDVECNTGIEKWPDTEAFKQPESGLLLLKLHGSIDWESYPNRPDENHPLPYTTIKKVAPEKVKKPGFRPAVIFGHRNKLTADGPFLNLLRAFQHELNLADRLTTIGYSFGDDHINVYLSNWINQNRNRKMKIINPKFHEISNEFTRQLQTLGKDRVEILEKKASECLQTLKNSI